MAVTAHIAVEDENENAHGRNYLLAFCLLEGEHSRKNIARLFFDILTEAGIKHKVRFCSRLGKQEDLPPLLQLGTITMDNTSNNNTFMDELAALLTAEGIEFDRDGNRIR